MAKDKNHSGKNQTFKNHRNGIKKPQRNKYISLKCCNARFLRNRRRAIKFDPSIKKSRNLTKRIEAKRNH